MPDIGRLDKFHGLKIQNHRCLLLLVRFDRRNPQGFPEPCRQSLYVLIPATTSSCLDLLRCMSQLLFDHYEDRGLCTVRSMAPVACRELYPIHVFYQFENELLDALRPETKRVQ